MSESGENRVTLRLATPDDAGRLLEIYAPYVLNTAITFEYSVPSVEEFRDRISSTLEHYPYIVAECGGVIEGYAYAGRLNPRKAYDWACEMSIYVDLNHRRHGLGRLMYEALEHILRMMNVQNVNACIAYPSAADPHLTTDSVKFHGTMGYRMVGEFHRCAYKFGTWYDMVWMEKDIGSHPDDVPDFIGIDGIRKEAEEYLASLG
ncbi:MAG: GNAT family N-acetyltransferase [Oscillospiraceae bacterium]|jgi:L-amino acid N-acyltransferase YncA